MEDKVSCYRLLMAFISSCVGVWPNAGKTLKTLIFQGHEGLQQDRLEINWNDTSENWDFQGGQENWFTVS